MKDEIILIETNITFLSVGNSLKEVEPMSVASIGNLEKNPYGNTFLTSSKGLKLVLPQRMIEIEVNEQRVVITDKKGQAPSDSDLITNYTSKFIEVSPNYRFGKYGFNYTADVSLKDSFKLLSNKLYLVANKDRVDQLGGHIAFKRENQYIRVFIESLEGDKYRVSLNYEYDDSSSFEKKSFNKKYLKGYSILEEIINAL